MGFKIDPNVIQQPEFLEHKTEQLFLEHPPGYWGMLHSAEAAIATQLASTHGVAGYYLGSMFALRGKATRLMIAKYHEEILAAAAQVFEQQHIEIPAGKWDELRIRFQRLAWGPSQTASWQEQRLGFAKLQERIVDQGMLANGPSMLERIRESIHSAERATHSDEPVFSGGPSGEELRETDISNSEVSDDGVPRLRTHEDQGLIDRNPLAELPAASWSSELLQSSPPKLVNNKPAYWVRWSTAEWPPLAKPESHMGFVHNPVNDGSALTSRGDSPSLNEVPGGTILSGQSSTTYSNGHIGKQWHPKLNRYWVEMPGRADFVRLGENIHYHSMHLTHESQGFLDWADLRKRIEEAIESNNVDEKIEDKVEDFFDGILEGVNLFGFPVGQVASSLANVARTIAMEIIDWAIDFLFGNPTFPSIIAIHHTLYNGKTKPMSSVLWQTKNPSSPEATPLRPQILKPNWYNLPANDRLEYLSSRALSWEGESEIPTKGPLPAQLTNTRNSPVLWARSAAYGGHIFIPVSTVDSDGLYALALRTEVRLAYVQFNQ